MQLYSSTINNRQEGENQRIQREMHFSSLIFQKQTKGTKFQPFVGMEEDVCTSGEGNESMLSIRPCVWFYASSRQIRSSILGQML
jgi:hypothetical protein